MTTSGHSNATLLLVTGLLSVGMAALGYYYLHRNSKKHRVVTNDSSKAGVHNSQKTSAPITVTEKEKIARVTSTVADIQTSDAGTSSTNFDRTTSRTIAASVSESIEKTAAVEMPMLPPASPEKETSKTTVEEIVESPVKVVESFVVVETVKEVNLSPENILKSGAKQTAMNLKKEIESPLLVLSKPVNTSPKKAPKTSKKVVETHKQIIESPKKALETFKKVVESPKQIVESPKKFSEQTDAVTIESPKKAPESPKKAPESPKKAPGSPKKVAENPKQTIESPKKVAKRTEAVTTESPKKFPKSFKRVVENPKQTFESPKKVVKQTEASTIEHPKEAPASPSKKKIASPEKATAPALATEELKSIKVNEDFIVAQAAAETASAFADKTLQDMLNNIALDQEYVQVDLTQSMTLSQSTPEIINIEDAVMKTEEVILTSAATEDEESIVEEEQEQEQEVEHAQVTTEPIEPASAEPVVDTAATTETLASPTTPDTTPVSWEAIALSPEMEAAPAQETTTPFLLDAPVESTESNELLSINVPAENTDEPAEDKNESSPVVDSGRSTEPVVDTAATTETLASPTTPDTTPVSWEAIALSPEMEAAPAQETTTPFSLDAPVESTESNELLLINVPAENTDEPAEDKNESSPVVDNGKSTEFVVDTAATTETLASRTTPDTTPVSWEAIALSPEMEAAPAQETTTPFLLDAPVESTESNEPFSINVPAENTDEPAEDKNESSSVVDSGRSTEPVVDTAATTETLASPTTPGTTPVSWEAIALSPEMEAAPAQETTTPFSLDAPVESTESNELLLINVPAENTEEPAEDKTAISPVGSGGSTPGKRNRNRSKKSKSKKKKGKKH